MFILKSQSRNEMNSNAIHSVEFKENFKKLFKADLAHLDTVQDFIEK
jgi:hypothetical protein